MGANSKNYKTFFRRGKCHAEMAIRDLREALKLRPDDKVIAAELSKLEGGQANEPPPSQAKGMHARDAEENGTKIQTKLDSTSAFATPSKSTTASQTESPTSPRSCGSGLSERV